MSLPITCPDCDEDYIAADSADIQAATDLHAAVCPRRPVRRNGTDAITCPDCGRQLAEIGKSAPNYEEQAIRALNLHNCPTTPRRNPMTPPTPDDPPRRPPVQQLLTHPAKTVARQAAKVIEEEAKLTALWRADLDNAKIREQIAAKEAKIKAELALLKKMKAQLRGKPTTRPAATGLPMDEIRTWAVANGHDVAPSGPVRKAVIEAWQAAHAEQVAS